MKKTSLPLIFLLLVTSLLWSQNKKELISDIENLKSELATTEAILIESKKNESVSKNIAESYAEQVAELQQTNVSLLKNLNNFTQASTQKLDNLGNVLESLKEKERQLKLINETLTFNDSISYIVLTDFKRTLGEDTNITYENTTVSVVLENTFLFGQDTTSYEVNGNAIDFLGKVANVINANPNMAVTVDNYYIAKENRNMGTSMAASIATILEINFAVAADRINSSGNIGSTNNSYIRVHPKFDAFYHMIRKDIKK